MLNLFEMFTRLGYIRLQSCLTFASFLVFEAKGELTMPNDELARSKPEHGWYTFPDVCGVGLLQNIGFTTQEKQNCKR